MIKFRNSGIISVNEESNTVVRGLVHRGVTRFSLSLLLLVEE